MYCYLFSICRACRSWHPFWSCTRCSELVLIQVRFASGGISHLYQLPWWKEFEEVISSILPNSFPKPFLRYLSQLTLARRTKRRVPPIDNVSDWVLSFALRAATIVASDSHRGFSLLANLEMVARLAHDNQKPVWLGYDTQFQQIAAAVPSEAKLKKLNSQLLQWSKQWKTVKVEKQSKVCLKWNEGKFCDFSYFPRAHHCTDCQKA